MSIAAPSELLNQPEFWGETTDPEHHTPDHFRYLVHAINPYAQEASRLRREADIRDGWEPAVDLTRGDQSINLYKHPEHLAGRVSLSMSLIDERHTATWGYAGLLISAPRHNVILTAYEDAGVANNNLQALLRDADPNDVISGDELLGEAHATDSPAYLNEVVALATRDGSQLALGGFFIKTHRDGRPINNLLAHKMQQHAARLNLPLVAIIEQSPFTQNEAVYENGATSVTLDGYCYALTGHERSSFLVTDEASRTHFAAPSEIKIALDFAVRSGGISEDQAAIIVSQYETADTKRQTPQVAFHTDGTIAEVFYYEGYDDDEHRISITENGYASRIRLAKQTETIQQQLLGEPPAADMAAAETPLSHDEADAIIARALESLNGNIAEQVRAWYA